MANSDSNREVWDTKLSTDSELQFKVAMRRNKILGQWVADQLKLEGDAANDVIDKVIKSDFEETGDEDVIRGVRKIFEMSGVDVEETVIRSQLGKAHGEAVEQFKKAD